MRERVDIGLRASIIDINYNYARFVGAAIESALAQTWPNVEVIVVDDGSTDDSRQVIARYADRAKILHKENGGQASAFNFGFRLSTGQLVILLDADDILYPTRVERVIAHYRPGVSKIQCMLDTVDDAGRDLNMPFPHYPPDFAPDEIKSQALKLAYYPCAPASGSNYAREYLEKVVPIPEEFRYNADGYLNLCAPLYSDVVTLPEPLGGYRVHGANTLAKKEVDGASYAKHIGYDLLLRRTFLRRAAELGYAVDEARIPYTKNHLENRMLSLRLVPRQHLVPEDSRAKLVGLGIENAWTAPDVNIAGRLLWTAWFLTIGFMPIGIVTRLVKQFRMQNFRPKIARALVSLSRGR